MMTRSTATRLRTALFLSLVFVVTGPLAESQKPAQRQPAPVMSTEGADWLLRPERIQQEDPDRMLASLEIQSGSVVADVGAGVGYHTWRLSAIVGPSGKVIAEDIQQGMLRMLKKNIDDRKLHNVDLVLGTPTDPKLPESKVDLVLMVDVYHEFSDPVAMMTHVRRALKPNGRVVLVEFRKEDPDIPILPLHKMSVQEVRSELEPMGFRFEKVLDFLPWQHVIIFSKE
jgi:ubiquinone/menaquinone biosynthesis C-methylase UbiE